MFVKVSINLPNVTYTQVDPNVDTSGFSMSANRDGYVQFAHKGKVQLLHRYVMGLQPGDKRQFHHLNEDVKDNRRANHRMVTSLENIRAKKKNNRNTSGLIGVYKRLRDGKYIAQIQRQENGKKHVCKFIGNYWCKNEAGIAYDAAVRARGGDYMVLNFPDEVVNTLRIV